MPNAIDALLENAGVEPAKRRKLGSTVEDLLREVSTQAAEVAVKRNDEKWEARLADIKKMIVHKLQGTTGDGKSHKAAAANTDTAAPDTENALLREDLAVAHQLMAKYGMDDLVWNHISARVPGTNDYYITPFPCLFDEVRASAFTVVRAKDAANLGNITGGTIHGGILSGRPDVMAICHAHTSAILAVSCLAGGLQFLDQNSAAFYERVGYHDYEGLSTDAAEAAALLRNLGPAPNHTLIMRNHGACTVGSSVAEAWVRMFYLDVICRNQLLVMKTGAPIHFPPPEMLEKSRSEMEVNGMFRHGDEEWESLKRLIFDGSKRNSGGRILPR